MKYPIINLDESFPVEPICPICKKNRIFEPNNFIVLEGGALLVDKKGDSILNKKMEGYLNLIWHAQHEKDVNIEGDSHLLEIVKDSKNGQFNLYFCSTVCLRKFFNMLVDDLEDMIFKS